MSKTAEQVAFETIPAVAEIVNDTLAATAPSATAFEADKPKKAPKAKKNDGLSKDEVKAIDAITKDLKKAGFKIGDSVLAGSIGIERIVAITSQGVVVEPLSYFGLVGTVQVSELSDPKAAQKTNRGTKIKPTDRLEMGYGLRLGDVVLHPMTGVEAAVKGAVFSSAPVGTVGDVRVQLDDSEALFDPAPLRTPTDTDFTMPAVNSLVHHEKFGYGQVAHQVGDDHILVDFLNGEKQEIHVNAVDVPAKQRLAFKEIGLLQPFVVGEQTFIKVGGSTAIAAVVFNDLESQTYAVMARNAVEVSDKAKRSFKQSDKVSLFPIRQI